MLKSKKKKKNREWTSTTKKKKKKSEMNRSNEQKKRNGNLCSKQIWVENRLLWMFRIHCSCSYWSPESIFFIFMNPKKIATSWLLIVNCCVSLLTAGSHFFFLLYNSQLPVIWNLNHAPTNDRKLIFPFHFHKWFAANVTKSEYLFEHLF